MCVCEAREQDIAAVKEDYNNASNERSACGDGGKRMYPGDVQKEEVAGLEMTWISGTMERKESKIKP